MAVDFPRLDYDGRGDCAPLVILGREIRGVKFFTKSYISVLSTPAEYDIICGVRATWCCSVKEQERL